MQNKESDVNVRPCFSTIKQGELLGDIAILASRVKFGDLNAINHVAQLMSEGTMKSISGQETMCAVGFVPTTVKRSGIGYIAARVAASLGLHAIAIEKTTHSFDYQASGGDVRTYATPSTLFRVAQRGAEDPCFAVLFDDTYVTGRMMGLAANALGVAGYRVIHKQCIVCVDNKSPECEWEIDIALYRRFGIEAITSLVKSDSYMFTGFMISFLSWLPQGLRNELISNMPNRVKSEIGRTVRAFVPGSPLYGSPLAYL